MNALRDKTVLITGAAGGIGSAVAREVLSCGPRSLILVGRRPPTLERLEQELVSSSAASNGSTRIESFGCDLSDPGDIASLCAQLSERSIDVLINNAGITHTGPFEEISLQDYERVIAVNLLATVRLTHGLLPQLIRNNGTIVNIASGAGLVAPGGVNAYATSKFGVVGFSDSLRAELRGRVRVCVICPGFVDTDIIGNSLASMSLPATDATREMAAVVRKNGVEPRRVARIIIRAIEKRRGLVVVDTLTRLAHIIRALLPWLADRVGAASYRRMRREGIL